MTNHSTIFHILVQLHLLLIKPMTIEQNKIFSPNVFEHMDEISVRSQLNNCRINK